MLAIALAALLAGCASPSPRPEGLLGIPAPGLPPPPGGAGRGEARGFLGLGLAEAAAGGLDELADAPGLAVETVIQNGPAEQAGIRRGDLVIALDGEPVRWRDAFENREAALEPGKPAVLTVRRGEAVSAVTVEVARRREPRALPPPGAYVEDRLAGIAVRGVPEARAKELGLRPGLGVELVGFSAKSPWREEAGLAPGDVVLGARRSAGGSVHTGTFFFSPHELLDRIAEAGPGGSLDLDVQRGPGKPRRVVAPLRAPPRVRDVNFFYLFRYERDEPQTDVSALFYGFRYRSGPKETRVNLFWLLSFAWAGDETLTRVR
jgi:hypothetical protein